MSEAPLPLHHRNSHRRFTFILCLLILASSWQPALAQLGFKKFASRRNSDAQVTVTSQFTPATVDRPALLFVTATIADEFHIYAVDQGTLPNDGGGPLATHISLAPGTGAQLVGKWQPLEPPHTHIDQEIWTGLELREHAKKVTWFAPIKIAAGANPASLTLAGKIEGQACNPQTCIPFEAPLSAQQGEGVTLPPGVSIQVDTAQAAAAPSSPAPSSPEALPETFRQPTTPQHSAALGSPNNLYDLSQVSLTASAEGSLVY